MSEHDEVTSEPVSDGVDDYTAKLQELIDLANAAAGFLGESAEVVVMAFPDPFIRITPRHWRPVTK